jgi:hypothetical protein
MGEVSLAEPQDRKLSAEEVYSFFSGRRELQVHLPDILSVTIALAFYVILAFELDAIDLKSVLRPMWLTVLQTDGILGTAISWVMRLLALEGIPILGYALVRILLAKRWHSCSFNSKTELPVLFAVVWFLLRPDLFGQDIKYLLLPLWILMNLAASIGFASRFWMSWVVPRLQKQGQVFSIIGNLAPSIVLVAVLIGQYSFVASFGASDWASFTLIFFLIITTPIVFGSAELIKRPWFARVFVFSLVLNFEFFYCTSFIILSMIGLWQLTHLA